MANWFDITTLVIILIFALLAFLKGFIKEIFSLINWVSAILITYFLGDIFSKFVHNYISKSGFADMASGSVLFVIVMIITSIITSKFRNALSGKIPESIDQSLGLAFGLIKGYLILCFFFSFITTAYSSGLFFLKSDVENQKIKNRSGPIWLQKSESYKILELGSHLIQPITDSIFDKINEIGFGTDLNKEQDKNYKKSDMDEVGDMIDKINKVNKATNILKGDKNNRSFSPLEIDDYENIEESNDQVESDIKKQNKTITKDTSKSGYEQKEIDKMDRLIDIINQ